MELYAIVVIALAAAAIAAVYLADSGAVRRKRDYENYDGYDPDSSPWSIGDRDNNLFD